MLPNFHRQKYQEFSEIIQQLHHEVAHSNLDLAVLCPKIGELQQFFRQQILPLPEEDVESSYVSRVRSIRTEISKQMRLLEMDMMFLAGARQIATAQTRLLGICDRLQTLIQYCQAILQTPSSESPLEGGS
ncbi:MAG: heterocyst frequency control protein PatD [Nostocaceae cyanobacterium]|nr:heterocyst frequency control protein PatD [Nostocaceae cyanobacterium]